MGQLKQVVHLLWRLVSLNLEHGVWLTLVVLKPGYATELPGSLKRMRTHSHALPLPLTLPVDSNSGQREPCCRSSLRLFSAL